MKRTARAMLAGGVCSAAVHAVVLSVLPSVGGMSAAVGDRHQSIVVARVVDASWPGPRDLQGPETLRGADQPSSLVAGASRQSPGPAQPAAARSQSTGRSPEIAGEAQRPKTHYARSEVDVPPLPKSAPDDSLLEGVPGTGLPVRLRVFVESDGSVSKVEVLHAEAGDAALAARAREMFLRTGYLPARRDGQDVPAFVDVEVVVDPAERLLAAPK